MVDRLFTGFSAGIAQIFSVEVAQDSQGVIPNVLSLGKRAALVKAVLKSQFPEVSS